MPLRGAERRPARVDLGLDSTTIRGELIMPQDRSDAPSTPLPSAICPHMSDWRDLVVCPFRPLTEGFEIKTSDTSKLLHKHAENPRFRGPRVIS